MATRCCFASAETIGEGVEAVPQADATQQVFGAAVPLAAAACQLNRQSDVLKNGERGDQIEELEDDADVAAAKKCTLVFVQGGQFDITAILANEHTSLRRTVDSGNEIQERALATARFSQ